MSSLPVPMPEDGVQPTPPMIHDASPPPPSPLPEVADECAVGNVVFLGNPQRIKRLCHQEARRSGEVVVPGHFADYCTKVASSIGQWGGDGVAGQMRDKAYGHPALILMVCRDWAWIVVVRRFYLRSRQASANTEMNSSPARLASYLASRTGNTISPSGHQCRTLSGTRVSRPRSGQRVADISSWERCLKCQSRVSITSSGQALRPSLGWNRVSCYE